MLLILLIPLSNTFISIYKLNININKKIENRRLEKNIIEHIKMFSNEKINKLSCKKKEFKNISDLLIYLDNSINFENTISKYNISITPNNMNSGMLNEFKGYAIEVNNEEGMYVPKE